MVICLKRGARDPVDATATPSSLALLKSRMVQPLWCQLTEVVLENRPLNRCLSVCLAKLLPERFSMKQPVWARASR